MNSLRQKLTGLMLSAFERAGYPGPYGSLELAPLSDDVHYHGYGLLSAARDYAQAPELIAQRMFEHLRNTTPFSRLSVAGPGFITVRVAEPYLRAHIEAMILDKWLGCSSPPLTQTGVDNAARLIHSANDYTDLIHSWMNNQGFDLEVPARFEDRTRLFSLYAATCAQSLVRKMPKYGTNIGYPIPSNHNTEQHLLFLLAEFPQTVALAAQQGNPDLLAAFASQLALHYMTYYSELRMRPSAREDERTSSVELSEFCARVFNQLLLRLGTPVPG